MCRIFFIHTHFLAPGHYHQPLATRVVSPAFFYIQPYATDPRTNCPCHPTACHPFYNGGRPHLTPLPLQFLKFYCSPQILPSRFYEWASERACIFDRLSMSPATDLSSVGAVGVPFPFSLVYISQLSQEQLRRSPLLLGHVDDGYLSVYLSSISYLCG